VLADRGVRVERRLWTQAGRAWLTGLELPQVPREIINDCCGLIDTLATPIGRLEREIGKLAGPDPRMVENTAIALDVTGLVADGDLGALAVDVHTDVHTLMWACVPALVCSEAYGCRAEQGTRPDLPSVTLRTQRPHPTLRTLQAAATPYQAIAREIPAHRP
jgi:hypothetical protein